MKLRIEKAIYGGAGLARATEGPLAGKTIFVPLALPGELVEAQIVDDRRSFANARLETVIEASPARIKAACPYFGACGGCDYQQASYEQQLAMKRDILRESLERAHLSLLPEMQTLSGPAWGYRNRIRLHVQRKPFSLGYKKRASNESLAVGECPIAAPSLVNALQVLNQEGARLGLGEWCDEVELFTSHDESELRLSFWERSGARISAGAFRTMGDALRQHIAPLSGATLFEAAGAKQHSSPLEWGEQALRYRVDRQEYRVSRGSFFQGNRFLVDPLLQTVARGRRGVVAWDLYAGVGLFARALAESFDKVIAVEDAPSSSHDLVHNLQETSARAVKSSTLDFLRRQQSAPDLVVVDPPRTGLGTEVTELLGRLAAAQIVYVSCDPATLSRDLHSLLQSGYQLQSLTMVDLFPQTYHMETVAVLTR